MGIFTDIIRAYNDGTVSLEAANAALKEAGAGFYIAPREESGWTEAEMREGFFPAPAGAKREPKPERPDMRRRRDLAGQTVIQETQLGRFEVIYDQDGYVRVAKSI